MTETETLRLVKSGAVAGLCPTTEANLGDGIFPAVEFLKAGGKFGLGSDSHISISPSEDLRKLEYSQRLKHLTRNALAGRAGHSTGRRIFESAAVGGAQALQPNMGAIEIGKRADFVVLDATHNSLLGPTNDAVLDAWIHALRPHAGQVTMAAHYRRLLAGSEIRKSHLKKDDRVQDRYSFRCQPQVMGACLDLLKHAAEMLLIEANGVSDNPLVFAEDGAVLSGGL